MKGIQERLAYQAAASPTASDPPSPASQESAYPWASSANPAVTPVPRKSQPIALEASRLAISAPTPENTSAIAHRNTRVSESSSPERC